VLDGYYSWAAHHLPLQAIAIPASLLAAALGAVVFDKRQRAGCLQKVKRGSQVQAL
jgi:hypothetical protein